MDSENKYGQRDMHVALLKMLSDFDSLCKENDIIYSLGFGSMLGAVREHGIIPWDDDIDIIVDRDNYKKLEKIADVSKIYLIERNSLDTLWIPRFRYREKDISSFGYVLTLDIFIIDNVPDKKSLAKIKYLLVLLLQGMIKPGLNLKKGNVLLKLASLTSFLTGKLVPLSLKFKLFNKVSSISNQKRTKKCACYNVEYIYAGREYDSHLLKGFVTMPFDELSIPVSNYYDSYLTVLYGNYMAPPKKEDRVPKHS